ncbi:hypothetical protein DEH18_01255 [Streptomyces sp. NHF165]|nr:hypothetical protein DEH18_01255 [Streptomyces sp. NHF165]
MSVLCSHADGAGERWLTGPVVVRGCQAPCEFRLMAGAGAGPRPRGTSLMTASAAARARSSRTAWLAVTSRIKQLTYLSTVAVVLGNESAADESADVRTACPTRDLGRAYADGHAAAKWAGEVLLREAHERFGLPVAVFRSNLILAHPRYRGRFNVSDVFTRLVLSLLAHALHARPPLVRSGLTQT